MGSPRASRVLPREKLCNEFRRERCSAMKPLIPIVVSSGLGRASLPGRAATDPHPLQPNAPRTLTVSEADTPPVIRAGLMQSTLIVLPADEKSASVFAGDTLDMG